VGPLGARGDDGIVGDAGEALSQAWAVEAARTAKVNDFICGFFLIIFCKK